MVRWLSAVALFLSFSHFAEASKNSIEVYLTVGKDNSTKEWAKSMCDTVAAGMNYSGRAMVTCNWLQKNQFKPEEIAQAKATGKFQYWIDLRENFQGQVNIRVVNWLPSDDIDFKNTPWPLKAGPGIKSSIFRLSSNLMQYFDKKDIFRQQAIREGMMESKELVVDKATGQIKDAITGEVLSEDQIFKRYVSESPRQANYLRAMTEVMMALGAGMITYYIKVDHNKRDWIYPTFQDAVKTKLTPAGWMTDTNSLEINEGHIYAGQVYYALCRGNGLKSFESLICSFTASAIWETTEGKEGAMINDQITTGIGGAVIAETLHMIARYIRLKGDTPWKRRLAILFDPAYALNEFLDQWGAKRRGEVLSDYNFNEDLYGKLEFSMFFDSVVAGKKESATGANSSYGAGIEVKGKVYNVESYEEEGQTRYIISDTAYAEAVLKTTMTDSSPKDFSFLTKVMWAGWTQKNLTQNADGTLRGYNWIIGPASATEIRRTYDGKTQDPNDFIVSVNVIGAMALVNFYRGDMVIRAAIEFYGDFALVRSYVVDQYKAKNGLAGFPLIIQEQNYHYAWGKTSRGQLIFEYGNWELALNGSYSSYDIWNDKYQDMATVTQFYDAHDSRAEIAAGVTYKVNKSFSVSMGVNRVRRAGEISGFGKRIDWQTRVSVYVNYIF